MTKGLGTQAETLMDQRLVVAVDVWESDSAYPSGHYVRVLGPIGDVNVETDVIILENDIRTAPFSPAVHACVPTLPWKVIERDFSHRWAQMSVVLVVHPNIHPLPACLQNAG